LMTEAGGRSETSINICQSARCNIPEESHLRRCPDRTFLTYGTCCSPAAVNQIVTEFVGTERRNTFR
jgi:hypothetical protein